jgi:predicted AAA+ superfamily ATPase
VFHKDRSNSYLEEFENFKKLRPVFIGGLRRSGTTLLQRLLDGHPELLVYPLEDCIIRDFYYATNHIFDLSNIQKN